MDTYRALELEAMLLGRHLTPLRQSQTPRRLERSGYALLTRISNAGPMSIGELSESLGLDVSTLNRQTAALVKQGSLVRVPNPDGGVARKFQLTEQGLSDLQADREQNVAGLRRLLEDWDAGDVDQLAALLRRFNVAIEERVGQSWPREVVS